jgi:hypothetical protein
MKKKNIISRIILSYLIFITFIYLFNQNNTNRFLSFLIVLVAGIFSIFILSYKMKSFYGFNIQNYLLFGFLLKLLIGFLFWQFYIFPNYFWDSSSFFHFQHEEYLLTESWMRDIAEDRIKNGFFYLSPQLLFIEHFEIHFLMSNMYLSGSFNPFDLSVQNSLFSIYTAFVILNITSYFGANSIQLRNSLLIALFQPFSIVSSIIWRDVFGQFFVSLGGLLMIKCLNKKFITVLILILLASLSMLIQRKIYFFFPLSALLIYIILKKKDKLILFFIPLIIFFIYTIDKYLILSDNLFENYGASIFSSNLWIFLPFNIFRIFLGPFPWIQWFNFDDASIFQIVDYFQSVVTITLLILVFYNIKNKKIKFNSIILLYLFTLFVFATLGTVEIHQVYMSTGVIFLIPLAINTNFFTLKYIRLNFFIFCIFIFLNILFLSLGLNKMGFGSSLR